MNFLRLNLSNNLIAHTSKIKLYQYKSNTEWTISVFIAEFKTMTELIEMWKAVSSVIGSTYQSELLGVDNEFEKWNLYLVYVCMESVSKEIKSKIENDMFSSRKIIEDAFTDELTDVTINKIIAKHITNSDLIIEQSGTATQDVQYVAKTNIWTFVYELEPTGTTEELNQLLQTLIK